MAIHQFRLARGGGATDKSGMDAVTIIGFGEAGRCFALAGGWAARAAVYDRLIGTADMDRALADSAVTRCTSLDRAVAGAQLLLSLVTADQALEVARAVAGTISTPLLFCDMNSVAPVTKRAAAEAIEAAGAHYIDVAVMAPVADRALAVPLLLSGARAHTARLALAAIGFTTMRVVGRAVGRASSIKMIRSVMVKGLEALTAECMLAAEAAGVRDDVLASLDGSERPLPWAQQADYALDRMMVHGLRRAAEMEEVVRTLDALGTGSVMSAATAARQRAIGTQGLVPPAAGLEAKLAQLMPLMVGAAWP